MKNMKQNRDVKKIYLMLFAFYAMLTSGLTWAGDVAEEDANKDIVTTASEAGFTTLVKALEATGLDQTLKGEGPFTVFAPSDAAFAKLPEGQLETLLMPENNAQLSALLSYHVVSGEVPAADVIAKDSASTVSGQDIAISVEDGLVLLNGTTQVVKTDIQTSNGVIHVVDSVLSPPNQ